MQRGEVGGERRRRRPEKKSLGEKGRKGGAEKAEECCVTGNNMTAKAVLGVGAAEGRKARFGTVTSKGAIKRRLQNKRGSMYSYTASVDGDLAQVGV